MAFPDDLTMVTVTHTIADAALRPLPGVVVATPTGRQWKQSEGSILPAEYTAPIENGTWTLVLPAVDQFVNLEAYRIEERPTEGGKPWGRPYHIAPTLEHAPGPVDATDVITTPPRGGDIVFTAGPATDSSMAQVAADPESQFGAQLKSTIDSRTDQRAGAIVPPLVAQAIAADPAPAQAAAAAVDGALVDSRIGDLYTRDQPDYVQLLAGRSRTTRLSLTKTSSAGHIEAACLTPTGDHHVTYRFNAPSDDYRIAGEVWTGPGGQPTPAGVLWDQLSTTGTYNTGSATVFTTEVGATFTVQIDAAAGGNLAFQFYGDNRGGMWRFTRNGQHAIDVSTWRASSGTTSTVLWDDLPAGTHTIRGEFIGADPANAPAGGVAPRGWLANRGTSGEQILQFLAPGGLSLETRLAPLSNRDFAIRIQPPGTSAAHWVPYHGQSTAIAAEPERIYLDGQLVDLAAMPQGQAVYGQTLEIVQHVYGRHPETGTTNHLEIWTTQTLRASGLLSMVGRWRTLTDVIIDRAFQVMGPVDSGTFDLLVTSLGNEYPIDRPASTVNLPLVSESDQATSYLYLSTSIPELAAAFRYVDPTRTIRRGQPNKHPAPDRAYLEQRSNGVAKHYQRLITDDTPLPAGTTFHFAGDYIHTVAPGIGDQLRVN